MKTLFLSYEALKFALSVFIIQCIYKPTFSVVPLNEYLYISTPSNFFYKEKGMNRNEREKNKDFTPKSKDPHLFFIFI